MRLRTRLTLTIASASLLLSLVVTLLGRELVLRRSREEFERLLGDGETEVRTRYQQLGDELARQASRLADPEDYFLSQILIAQARGGIDDDLFRQLGLVTPRVMQERGLDLLTVLGPRGEILACGHYPGRMGDQEPLLLDRGKRHQGQGPVLLMERLLLDGKPTNQLTLQIWHNVQSSLGASTAVMAGRRLGPALSERLRLRGGTEARILDAAGTPIGGPRAWSRFAAYPQRLVHLAGPTEKDAARVILAVPDDGLRLSLRVINYAALALSGSGLLLALLFGHLTARRITRPLQDLADGAARVAAGDLDVTLPVRRNDELGQVVMAFNRSIGELKDSRERLLTAERIAAWQDMARRLAHEIKNPLFPIQTSIETLQRVYQKKHPDFDEIFQESTRTILEEVSRLKTIVSEFGQFARLPRPRPEALDLGEFVRSLLPLYAGDGPLPETDIPEGLPTVQADREQLSQVLLNLLKNAREAQADLAAPWIGVTLRKEPGWLCLEVLDRGPGIAEENLGRVFAPYFTTRSEKGGTGLGLAIVSRIILDHGGRVEAKNRKEGGASLTIKLPLPPDPANT